MTIDEAHEYVMFATEAEGEQRGEYLAGASSLGYDPSEWAIAYDGYRTALDPDFTKAMRIITAHRDARALVKVTLWPKPDTTDDIPF